MVGFYTPGQRVTPRYATGVPTGMATPDPRWGFVHLFKTIDSGGSHIYDIAPAKHKQVGSWRLWPYNYASLSASAIGFAAGTPTQLRRGNTCGFSSNVMEVNKTDFVSDEYTLVTLLLPDTTSSSGDILTCPFEWINISSDGTTSTSQIALYWWTQPSGAVRVSGGDPSFANSVSIGHHYPFDSRGMVGIVRSKVGNNVEVIAAPVGNDAVIYTTPTPSVAVNFDTTKNQRVKMGTGIDYSPFSNPSYSFTGWISIAAVLDRAITDAEANELTRNPAALFLPEYEFLGFSTGGFEGATLLGDNSFHVHTGASGAITSYFDGGGFSIDTQSTVSVAGQRVLTAGYTVGSYSELLARTKAYRYLSAEFHTDTASTIDLAPQVLQQSVVGVATHSTVDLLTKDDQQAGFWINTSSAFSFGVQEVRSGVYAVETASLVAFDLAAARFSLFGLLTQSAPGLLGQRIVVATACCETRSDVIMRSPALPISESFAAFSSVNNAVVTTGKDMLFVRGNHVE